MPHTNRLDPPASLSSLVGDIITDTQSLVRQEIALARREIRDEADKARTAVQSFAVGACTLLLGGILLCLMVAHLLFWLTEMPLWICYGIVGGVLLFAGVLLLQAARNKAGSINLLPPQTVQTMKENVQWIKNQT